MDATVKTRRRLGLLCGTAAAALAAGATYAQDAGAAGSPRQQAQAQATAAGQAQPAQAEPGQADPEGAPVGSDASQVEEVVVTGSRLGTTAQNAPNPVQVLTRETVALTGVTQIADSLDRIPALQASESTAQADGGAVSLNLRGLGTARTLVLVNGRRHVAGVPGSASVDVSTIPSGLIDRVEVLTGGASAVYGSDAVTGVVNFILRRDFVGTEVELQGGLSGEGDVPELFGSILHGRDFGGGRGNVTVALQANTREALTYGDRDWSRNNRVANDYANPDLFFQQGDPLPPGRTAANTLGSSILLSGQPRFANTDPGLISRAGRATPRAFINDPRFSISSTSSLVGIDLDGDGFAEPAGFFSASALNDQCRQSRAGRSGFGCFVVDPRTGQLRPFQDGRFAGFSNQSGGDGTAESFNDQTITSDDRMLSANIFLTYEVSPLFEPFLEAKAVYNEGVTFGGVNSFDDSIPISLENPFIPDELRALVEAEIAADPSIAETAKIVLSRDNLDVVDPEAASERRTYRFVTGATGEFPNGWTYEASLNYGRTEQTNRFGTRLEDRFFSAVDVVTDPATGQPVCRSTLDPTAVPPISGLYPQFPGPIPNPGATFTPGPGSPCRPANLFGERTVSREAQQFIGPAVENEALIEQSVASLVLIGDSERLFSLPGGPIGFAVGAEYREEKSDFDPNDFDETGQDFQYLATAAVRGKFDVREAFAEISLPIFDGAPLADTLTVSAAVRGGEYSTVGQTSSYKVDAVYAPVRDIRFRGGLATTVRAPNISELFSPLTSAVFRPIDPCDREEVNRPGVPASREANCRQDLGIPPGAPYEYEDPLTARFTGVTGGNPDLEEETSDSYTYGVVLRPRFLSGFSATIDYYNIKIEQAISAISAQDIVDSCYDAASLDNQFCGLFTRNRDPNSPTFLGFNFLRQVQLNFAGLEASGIDFSANYRLDLDSFGRPDLGVVNLGVAGTSLQDRRDFPFVQEPDRPNPEKRELSFPELALNTTVQWRINDFTVSLFSNFQSEQTLPGVEIENVANFTPAFAEAGWTHDASVRWAFRPESSLTFGVQNLTDREPFVGAVATPVSAVGRYFFLRLVARM